MKLEKRNESGPAEPENESGPAEPEADMKPTGKKPVVVYIMVLFIAAFLLMAWSFASHQRSNTEALGRLQSSVTAMQGVQELQDQVISLQKELAEAEKSLQELEDEEFAQRSAAEHLEKQCDAMELLYILQQQYSAGEYAACLQTMDSFESGRYGEALPRLASGSVTQPEDRYQQLKEAVEAREAEAAQAESGDQEAAA